MFMCMRVDGSSVDEFQHFQGLNKTTPEQIRFSCDADRHNAIMHTHPGQYGISSLSDQDKETLREVSWIDVSCVVGGSISDERVVREGISCFSSESGEIFRLKVLFN